MDEALGARLQYGCSTVRGPREAGGGSVGGLPHHLLVFDQEAISTVVPT